MLGSYFLYTSIMALVLPVAWPTKLLVLVINLAILAIINGFSRTREQGIWLLLRNLFPFVGVLLAYQQMGWFAQPHENFELEQAWVIFDRILLQEWGLLNLIESQGAFFPGLLELLYLLTYALGPIGMLILLLGGRIKRADHYLSVYVASVLLAYALFPYFPSEPPRSIFPGELSGHYETIFKQFNWWLLGGTGIHTSVFPSGHVSSAFGVGFGLFLAISASRLPGILMTAVACGVAVSTVYGRYHYAVDAVAGLAVSVFALLVCPYLMRVYSRK